MDALNPNHAVTKYSEAQWHKIVGLLMLRENLTEFEITPELIDRMGDNEKAVVMDCRGGKMVIRLISMAEAEVLAKQEGGLAV